MTEALQVRCPTLADTQAVAATVAGLVQPGDAILLSGDLGAGKTAWTQGFARALGVTDVVNSPTFTLVRSYRTEMGSDLLHADVYRLERLAEVVDLGLPDQLEDGAIAVIEWGERAAQALLADYLEIAIEIASEIEPSEIGEGESGRLLTLRVVGPGWAPRWPALQRALYLETV